MKNIRWIVMMGLWAGVSTAGTINETNSLQFSSGVALTNSTGTSTLSIGSTNAPAKLYIKGANSAYTNRPLVLIEGSSGRTNDFLQITGNGGSITNFRIMSDGSMVATNALNQVNANTLGGATLEDVMRVGVTFYFRTNTTSYGVVTGRVASVVPISNVQTSIYSGVLTNGQYLATYMIASNEMPTLIQRGLYTFNFIGYHTGNNRYPTIGGELYIINATNGNVAQEFTSAPVLVPYSATGVPSTFSLIVSVTNDVPKDGYVFALKTKVVNIDGYTGSFYSFFGYGYWAGFTMPLASGVYVTHAEYDVRTQAPLNDGSRFLSSWNGPTNTLYLVSPTGAYTNLIMTTSP